MIQNKSRKKRKKILPPSEIEYSLIEEVQKTRTQFNTLKEQSGSILDQYETLSNKLITKEEELNDRESTILEKEEKLKEKEKEMHKALQVLQEREEKIANIEKKLASTTTDTNQQVTLDIGGAKFSTVLSNLLSVKDTLFTEYFSDNFNPSLEKDKKHFFDRSNKMFPLILDYLRGNDIESHISNLNYLDLDAFIADVVYYKISPIYYLLPLRGKRLLKSKYSINLMRKTVEFDPKLCSSKIQLETPTRAKRTLGGKNVVVFGTQCNYFKVKLISNCGLLRIGFAPRPEDDVNSSECGYYLSTRNRNSGNVAYCNKDIEDGSIVECELRKGTISYSVDGKDYGVAFNSIGNEQDLLPAFDVSKTNCTFEFINE